MADPDMAQARHVLVTGADGYLGRLLVRRLLGQVEAPPAGLGRLGPGATLTLVDRAFGAGHPEPGAAGAAPAVRRIAADLREPHALEAALQPAPELVFHLAGITSRQAEDDWSLGMQVNLAATLGLLEALRAQASTRARPPVWVQASSIGVFGVPLPAAVDDDTAVAPTLSYGTAKRMVELLLADATRRGWLDARSLRLPSVVARPVAPGGALSAFASDLIREPLAGRDYTCPIGPEGTLWLLSGATCVEQLLHAATLPADGLPPGRAWTLPALHARVDAVVQALGRRHGAAVAARVHYRPDTALHAQFARWPPLRTPLADRLGFRHDGTLERLLERARTE
jgi:nucleoside-diphosphate-sugar epimerase